MNRLLLALFILGAVLARAQVPDREQLEKRLAAVDTLIERSSAARQIEASGDARAQAYRDRARETRRRAADALKAGDLATSARLLPVASLQMFEGVRLAGADEMNAQKRRADFRTRLESVKSLATAQRRISGEKNGAGSGAETARAIDALVADAERLSLAGEDEPARMALDKAYLVAKASIGAMRGGDTLVRSLEFASKQDEYLYEVDRNDTHRMLLKLLVADPGKAAAARAATDRADELRASAQGRASAGAYEEAVRLLEDSTRELVRAIRGAGIYIPG